MESRMSTNSNTTQPKSRLQTALLVAVLAVASIDPLRSLLAPPAPIEGRLKALEATSLEITDGLKDISKNFTATKAMLRESSDTISERIGGLESSDDGVSASIAAIGHRLGNLETISTQLNDLAVAVRRMGGQLVVDEPATEVQDRIRAVLEQWLPAEAPAELPGSSDELREEIDLLYSSMQTRMRIVWSDDLEMLEWWADALDLLNAATGSTLASPARLSQLSARLLEAPARAPAWTLEKLDRRIFDHTIAMIEAGLATVEEGDLLRGSTSERLGEYRVILGDLSESAAARASTAVRDRVKNLSTLVDSLIQRQTANALDDTLQELRAERERILQISDEQIRIELLYGLNGKSVSLLAEVDGEESSRLLAAVQSWRRDTEARSTKLQEDQRLRYQGWALTQIELFNAKYERAKNLIQDDEVAFEEAMIAHLAPIDVQLLEDPIRSYFSAAWEKGWSELGSGESPGEREHLLRKISVTRKRGIDSV
jgi:hypothetical protein